MQLRDYEDQVPTLAPILSEHVSGEKLLQRRLRGFLESDEATARAGPATLRL